MSFLRVRYQRTSNQLITTFYSIVLYPIIETNVLCLSFGFSFRFLKYKYLFYRILLYIILSTSNNVRIENRLPVVKVSSVKSSILHLSEI